MRDRRLRLAAEQLDQGERGGAPLHGHRDRRGAPHQGVQGGDAVHGDEPGRPLPGFADHIGTA